MANEADVETIGNKRFLKYTAFAKECHRPPSRAVPKERSLELQFSMSQHISDITLHYHMIQMVDIGLYD